MDQKLKSDIGAQAAWKGFSSQTMYIAHRLISDTSGYEYYPEDIEDLVIKNNGVVEEAVQIKNISSDLSISSLASTKTSKNGDGFFGRMCSLHEQFPSLGKITVAYFGSLGTELKQISEKNGATVKAVKEKLEKKHGLSAEAANWLVDSLSFEKVSLAELKQSIQTQIASYVPVMPAPQLAEELLIQYISQLSNNKGFTTKQIWQDKIHSIGVSISSIDGFYKEYNKSLVRLSELQLGSNADQIRTEFLQGVSAHPAHIRLDLDLRRPFWLQKIRDVIDSENVAIVKGVSGQGKSMLCYRYLIDNYPEGCIFCVRTIASEEQAQNLVAALDGLGKNNKNIIIYIDVLPGESHWAFLLQELQSRGMTVPVLISIRDEDYNATQINGKSIKYGVIELELAEDEAHQIYDYQTIDQPNKTLRTFEEAWLNFGGNGPLIEFIYLLTNEQTLRDRIEKQVAALIREKIDDAWIDVLRFVSYAGRLGCSVNSAKIKQITHCSNMEAAISRLKDEYLVRVIDRGKRIEALHPVRAQIVCDALCEQTASLDKDFVFEVLSCISSRNTRLLLLDYFSRNKFDNEDIQKLSQIQFSDWLGYANAIKSTIWLDCKCYAENNMDYFRSLSVKHGSSWLGFLPLDLTGLLQSAGLIVESMTELFQNSKANLQEAINEAKQSLTSLSLDYRVTDYFLKNSTYPKVLPNDDEQRSSFGYSLFWMAKRGKQIEKHFDETELISAICGGGLQPSADAIRGLFEQPSLTNYYLKAAKEFTKKLISKMRVISFAVSDESVTCKFIPPMGDSATAENANVDNQYWRIKMLNILQQLYPDIEYINIELIGVDLLDDLGIPAMDNKLHIHKSRRTIRWISEVNGWVRIRIEYAMRPSTWHQYVFEIDAIRKCIVQFTDAIIKLIDDIYKKGRYTKERWQSLDRTVKELQRLTLPEKLLPACAVDPYCLYSESNAKSPFGETLPLVQLLSVGKYESFRGIYRDLCFSMANYCDQFSIILLTRKCRQDISIVNNPGLAMFNLYKAAKALSGLQQEYSTLFARYSTLDVSFSDHEQESLLTLVNMWRHVLDTPPRGIAIAYDAKQKYRKGKNYFRNSLNSILIDETTEIIATSEHIYIKNNLDIYNDSLEKKYKESVLQLRNAFRSAIPFSSDRWYLETQPLELAYIPAFSGSCFPIAYSIPFYRLLDSEEEKIADSMFPCEIDRELLRSIEDNTAYIKWVSMYRVLGTVRLYMKQFYQVFQESRDAECVEGMSAYTTALLSEVTALWNDYVAFEDLLNELPFREDEQSSTLLGLIKLSFSFREKITAIITKRLDPSSILEEIEKVINAIFILSVASVTF